MLKLSCKVTGDYHLQSGGEMMIDEMSYYMRLNLDLIPRETIKILFKW